MVTGSFFVTQDVGNESVGPVPVGAATVDPVGPHDLWLLGLEGR